MLKIEKISAHQFTVLAFMFTLGSAILIAPTYIAKIAKQDAWIAAICGILIGTLFILLLTVLGKRFPDMTLIEYNEKVLGKWLGKFVSLLFIFYFFIVAALMLREIGYFITMQLMPETPITAIHITFICVVVYGVRLGLEVIGRSAEIFLPWVVLLLIVLVIFLIPETKLQNIQPVLEYGWKPLFQGAVEFNTFTFLQFSILLMLIPNLNPFKKVRASFLTGALIGGFVLFLIILISILVLGADTTERHIYPSFILAKKINIGDFFTRIEVLMAGIWFITIFFKLAICFYASSVGLAQTLNLKEYRILTFPLAIILVVFALVIYPDLAYFDTVISPIMTTYSLLCGLFLPLLLLVVDVIRQKFSRQNTSIKK